MKKVRNNVFEVNSSSSHSIVLGGNDFDVVKDTIVPDENGIITLTGGEYGWDWFKSNDAFEKANYVAQSSKYNDDVLDILIDVIKENTLCKDVIINLEEDGYIDHQSYDVAPNTRIEIEDFIFNKNSWLFGGNDNGSEPFNFYNVPEYKKDGTKIPFQYNVEISVEGFNESYKYRAFKDEDLDNLAGDLDPIYSSLTDKVSFKDWKAKGDYYCDSYYCPQKVSRSCIVLLNKELLKSVIEGRTLEQIHSFIENNLHNPNLVYKIPFKIKKL